MQNSSSRRHRGPELVKFHLLEGLTDWIFQSGRPVSMNDLMIIMDGSAVLISFGILSGILLKE